MSYRFGPPVAVLLIFLLALAGTVRGLGTLWERRMTSGLALPLVAGAAIVLLIRARVASAEQYP